MLNTPDSTDLPDCLRTLSDDQKALVNDQLCNNESSDDAELTDYLISEGGLSQEQATAVIAYRPEAFRDPFFHLFDPAESAPRP